MMKMQHLKPNKKKLYKKWLAKEKANHKKEQQKKKEHQQKKKTQIP